MLQASFSSTPLAMVSSSSRCTSTTLTSAARDSRTSNRCLLFLSKPSDLWTDPLEFSTIYRSSSLICFRLGRRRLRMAAARQLPAMPQSGLAFCPTVPPATPRLTPLTTSSNSSKSMTSTISIPSRTGLPPPLACPLPAWRRSTCRAPSGQWGSLQHHGTPCALSGWARQSSLHLYICFLCPLRKTTTPAQPLLRMSSSWATRLSTTSLRPVLVR